MPRPVHFEIHVQDPERARAFYEAVFGWRFERHSDDYWLILTGEGPGIDGGMMRRTSLPPGDFPMAPIVAWMCTVEVSDLDVYLERVRAHGGSPATARFAVSGVGWLAYAKDSEGNLFGMLQPDPEAP
jgi:predicted enzyme related to lactoylglutathione lyase